MSRPSLLGHPAAKLALLVLAGAGLLVLQPGSRAASQQLREVFVSNFPQTQQVIGTIKVSEPIPATDTAHVREVVSPVDRDEIVHLIEGGTVDAAGFTTVTVSLYGFMKSGTYQRGDIGVLLIPDEELFDRALVEAEDILLPIEVTATVDPTGSGYFAGQRTFPVGFERYRVLFYNSSTKSAEANLRVYFGQ